VLAVLERLPRPDAAQSHPSAGIFARYLMPWANVFATGCLVSGSDDRQIFIAGNDNRNAPVAQSMDAVIDAVTAGIQPGGSSSNYNLLGVVTKIMDLSGAPQLDADGQYFLGKTGGIGSTILQLDDQAVVTEQGNVPGQLGRRGMVQINGEVFAYDRPDNQSNTGAIATTRSASSAAACSARWARRSTAATATSSRATSSATTPCAYPSARSRASPRRCRAATAAA